MLTTLNWWKIIKYSSYYRVLWDTTVCSSAHYNVLQRFTTSLCAAKVVTLTVAQLENNYYSNDRRFYLNITIVESPQHITTYYCSKVQNHYSIYSRNVTTVCNVNLPWNTAVFFYVDCVVWFTERHRHEDSHVLNTTDTRMLRLLPRGCN